MISATEALERLKAGNARFVAGTPQRVTRMDAARRAELVDGQHPFAVILGCADSRAPAGMIFDQGLGDLFVIRVAGNVAAPSQIGSVEFAVEHFGTRLVVVLGHSGCGAVKATLADLDEPITDMSPNLRSIVDRIRPAVESVVADAESDADADGDKSPTTLERAVRANVTSTVNQLRSNSEGIERLIHDDGLVVVGAEYSLETGVVGFVKRA